MEFYLYPGLIQISPGIAGTLFYPPMKRVYLFDIDGTLLKVKNKANRRVIEKILEQHGIDRSDVRDIDFAGKTDRSIFSSLLGSSVHQLFDQVKERYLTELDRQLTPDDVHIFKGVHRTIEYLKENNAILGLLTGNFARAARIKLACSGLNNHFEFGAFGDDSHHRNELPPLAYETLQGITNKKYQPSDLVIIGDTPRDIRCARSFGAISVAVATGDFSAGELSTFGPDVVLDSMDEFPGWVEEHLR